MSKKITVSSAAMVNGVTINIVYKNGIMKHENLMVVTPGNPFISMSGVSGDGNFGTMVVKIDDVSKIIHTDVELLGDITEFCIANYCNKNDVCLISNLELD